ncbi:TlpA disulfide reductase family protein [Bacteroides sp. 51]|uniref:TlpA family protein disulfide reductase n=1 Tax=Bacteroides sp. 51 TaxID=2302938 RepID=UPI0013D89738|nr:TlpA disulfide reductase family protein [Bacteroides sp. 51]NDV83613.1 TlpA family protein disulfide reductase [Bacteroides sp. 51]
MIKKVNLKFRLMVSLGMLLLLTSGSPNSNHSVAKRTVIAGVVENFTDDKNVLIINYCDPLSDEHQSAQNLKESAGYFHAEHEYIFGQNITIRYANQFINLFVSPGDSVFVTIDASKVKTEFNHAVTFSGAGATTNKELFLWTNHIYNKIPLKFDNQASPDNYIKSIEQTLSIIQDSIQSYDRRNHLSDFMKEWAFVDHKFILANYIMDYQGDPDRWAIFTHPVFDVFNEHNFQTMYFQYHLMACIGALIQKNKEIPELMQKGQLALMVQTTKDKLVEATPEGRVRDVMLFSLLKNLTKEKPELHDSLSGVNTYFSDALFYDKLVAHVEQIKGNKVQQVVKTEKELDGIIYLNNNNPEELQKIDLLPYLIEKHKNKVLYIDVWATWCGPCLKGMEMAPEVHKYFKTEDVVFINLCLESNMNQWKKTVDKYHIAGENYFLGDNASKLFRAAYNLSGFPSYMIIDKTGGLRNPAPGISNLEAVIEKIESCLK